MNSIDIFRGKFAKVFLCLNEKDKKLYAMKILKKKRFSLSFQNQDYVETELAILKKLVKLKKKLNKSIGTSECFATL